MNKRSEAAMRGDYREGDEHDRFRSLLPAFAMVCLEGSAGGPEWNTLETHLDGCASCRAELEELLQLLEETYTGTLEAELESPVPDLAYLPPWSTSERPHELVAVVHIITAAVRQVLIQFTETLTSAMRQPEPAGEFRSEGLASEHSSGEEDQAPPEAYTYEVHGSSADDLTVAVDFIQIDVDRHLYRVKVTVIDQDQDPFSQEGHRVVVHYEAQTVEAITDTSGCASFHDIPYAALPQLQITIHLRSAT